MMLMVLVVPHTGRSGWATAAPDAPAQSRSPAVFFCAAGLGSTAYSISTVPAFSNVSVPFTNSPTTADTGGRVAPGPPSAVTVDASGSVAAGAAFGYLDPDPHP
jgi:hypothetical protein